MKYAQMHVWSRHYNVVNSGVLPSFKTIHEITLARHTDRHTDRQNVDQFVGSCRYIVESNKHIMTLRLNLPSN